MDERFRDLPTQATLDLNLQLTAGEWLRRIRETSRTEVEKGQWFENLFARLARNEPAFELEGIWRWAEWPERERLTGLSGQDVGVDLVAKHRDGTWIAVQCKCYAPSHRVTKDDVQAFLAGSQHETFGLRWIVATCRWGRVAEQHHSANEHPPDRLSHLPPPARNRQGRTSGPRALGTAERGDRQRPARP